MSEFRRLLDDNAGSTLHAVLEAGLRDGPSHGQLARAARTLGVGAAGMGAAQSAAATETARALHASLWSGLAKWGAVGLVLGGAALSPLVLSSPPRSSANAVQLVVHRALPTTRPTAQIAPAPGPSVPQTEPTAIAAAQLPPSAPIPAPQATPRPTPTGANEPPLGTFQPLTAAPSSASVPTHTSDLDSEVALLDSARSALKRDDPNTALTWLDRHARLGAPALAAEATLLRVQALIAAGRGSEARTVARRAVGSANTSAYAQRLNKLVGLPEK